jgi:REP element-mobilizing transposase RayT
MFDRDKHHRRTIRLKGWDYSSTGAYFVTICTWKKECIFEDDDIRQIIVDEWHSLPKQFRNVHIDEFIVMPNHIHGIIWIKPVGAGLALPNNISNTNEGGPRPAPTLGDIVCAFKSKITVNINRYRNTPGYPVWQRNYYEHIIRNEDELNRIRQYIIENPLRWEEDPENPENIKLRGEI